MDTAITYLCNLVMVVSFAYFGVGLVLELIDRWNETGSTVKTKVPVRQKAKAKKQLKAQAKAKAALPEAKIPITIRKTQKEAIALEVDRD